MHWIAWTYLILGILTGVVVGRYEWRRGGSWVWVVGFGWVAFCIWPAFWFAQLPDYEP